MSLYCVVFFLFLVMSLSAQAQGKAHYRILENGNEVTSAPFIPSLETIDLDYLRFTDARRTIPIENTEWVVELFSGNELLSLYNKPISPLNSLQSLAVYPNQVFVISPGNTLKTKIID